MIGFTWSFVGNDPKNGQRVYFALLQQTIDAGANHYGQIILGRVWKHYSYRQDWCHEKGGKGFRTRKEATLDLLLSYLNG